MIGLSDSQLEIVMRTAEPLAEESCQEFLERVAAALAAVVNVRGQITDDDVSAAVQLALRGLINNSAVWKNRNPTSLQDRQFDAPSAALTTWRLLGACCEKLRKWAAQVFATSSRYSRTSEIPVDRKNDHFDRKLIKAE
jgi:hypothetical protein